MKVTTLFASIIGSSLLAMTPATAGPWDGNPDLEQGILNRLDQTAYMGTSMAGERQRVDIYNGAFTGPDVDPRGFAIGSANPERGHGDQYGWILLDVMR